MDKVMSFHSKLHTKKILRDKQMEQEMDSKEWFLSLQTRKRGLMKRLRALESPGLHMEALRW